MTQFIKDYLSSLSEYHFSDKVLNRIAMERGVSEVTEYSQLEQKEKDLLLADLMFTIYISPTSTASISKKHGSFSQSIGSQTYTDKKGLRNLIVSLYLKWGDDKLESVNALDGGLSWIAYED